jgi:hypothetical protein
MSDTPDEPTTESAPQAVPVERVADPALLSLVARRLRPEIVRSHQLPTWAGELPNHLDPADWRAGFLAVHDGGPPPDVREALNEMTPQSHLRDLFRPEYSREPVPLDLHPLPLDPGGRAAYAEVRASMRREPLPWVARSLDVLAELAAQRRNFLHTPWQPFLRDDEPRREVFVAIEPSLTA